MEKAKQPDFIQKEDGSWYYNGDLNLSSEDVSDIIWPDNLTINGYLDLSRSNIKTLPDNLTIGRHLSLMRCDIKYFSDNLEVEGDLYLNESKEITTLPKNLKCRILDIRDTNIKEIKKDVKIQRTLYFSNKELKIEEGFYCEGIKFININESNLLSKRNFDILPRSLIKFFDYYDSSINKLYFYIENKIEIRRNLINTESYRYRLFLLENKKALIKALYERSQTT